MHISKFWILVVINLPLIAIGIIGSIAGFKTAQISKKRCVFQVIFWLLIGVVLVLLQPIYDALVRHNLTNSPSMSLFDIVLLTGLLFALLIIKHTNDRAAKLNAKVSRLHENLVIAEQQRHWDRER